MNRFARVQVAALVAASASALACGGEVEQPSGGASPSRAVIAEAGERAVVATIDGRPVYDDCVVARAKALGVNARKALDQCIDFELLAARAEADGLADHPDVVAAGKRESVRALLAQQFEPSFDGPEDVAREQVEKVWKRPAVYHRYNHPEYRLSHFARVELPKDEPRGTEADRRAEAVARKIHRALEGMKLERDEFLTLAQKAADGHDLTFNDKVYSASRKRTDPAYAEALFNVDEVNTVSQPARTRWGWDVILLSGIKPAQSHTFEQAEANLREKVFPSARESAFLAWVSQLRARRAIEVFAERLPSGGVMAGLGPGPGSPTAPLSPGPAPTTPAAGTAGAP